MFESFRSLFSFFELCFLPEERLRPPLYVRVLMGLGGALCLVFGTMSSFDNRLASNILWLCPQYTREFHTYSLLLTAFGGALGLTASFRRMGRSLAFLSLWGIISGLVGISFSLFEFTAENPIITGGFNSLSEGGCGYILGSVSTAILLGIFFMLSYPISLGVVHPVLAVPLVAPTFLHLLTCPRLHAFIFILELQSIYTYILFIVLPALVVLIPVNIAMVKAFRFMKSLELRTEKETINKVRGG
ncbi:hypothetical protein J7L60_04790 [Candidatus Bathyarchaeota archaeon]|nr:hypothetical protein [Candidatus Bathyarchaeota archaeon]